MRSMVLLPAVLVALAGCGPRETPPEQAPPPTTLPEARPERGAMEKVAQDFAAAWNQGNVAGIVSLFAEESDEVDPSGRFLEDRGAIEKHYTTMLEGAYHGSRISIDVDSVRIVDGVGLVDGSYTVTGIKGPDGADLPPTRGRYFNVMTGMGSSWLIACSRPFVPLPPPVAGS
jgi:uncharacterized protein (TIGR02246 family)